MDNGGLMLHTCTPLLGQPAHFHPSDPPQVWLQPLAPPSAESCCESQYIQCVGSEHLFPHICPAPAANITSLCSAVEEGSSFFSNRMMWYAVVAAGMALYVTEILTYAQSDGGGCEAEGEARGSDA